MLAQAQTTKRTRKPRKLAALTKGAIVNSERHTAYVHSASSDPHSGFVAAIYKGVNFVRYHYWESSLRDVMQTMDNR